MAERQPASDVNSMVLVDDEHDILDILERALQRAGYHVTRAHNGQHALHEIALRDYDLIITNVRMPGLPFYRTCRCA
jgi:DNA-binding response OmpR family regulator